MTIKELYDGLEKLNGTDRETVLTILFTKFASPLSQKVMKQFQDKWDFENSNWKQFREHQNTCIKKCIDVELSEKAQQIRARLKLSEFTWDTKLD